MVRPLPAGIVVELADGDQARVEQLLAAARSTFTPEILLAVEQLAYAVIDRRYPDDPRSLFNWRYRTGQQRKKRLKVMFDEAFDRLFRDSVSLIDEGRAIARDDQLAAMRDALYFRRRPLFLTREADNIRLLLETGLASNVDLQAQLLLNDQAHRHGEASAARQHRESRETDAWRHDQSVGLERVRAEIESARERLRQPHELKLELYGLLRSLNEHQMTLHDRAVRNPALEDRLRMQATGLLSVITSVNGLVGELNKVGPNKPTPEDLQQQAERILVMAMEQYTQWIREARQTD